MKELAGKVALVTGGSRGIGAAIARRLAQQGAAVALHLRELGRQGPGGRQADRRRRRARPGHPGRQRRSGRGHGGRRADRPRPGPDRHPGKQRRYLHRRRTGGNDGRTSRPPWAIDVRAVFVASQAAARHMGEGGRIITVGSALAERVPAPGFTLYFMSKAALTGLTRGLARDLGPRGITATVVHGGLIDTDMNPADGPGAGSCAASPRSAATASRRHRRHRRPPGRRRRPLRHRHRDHRRRRIRRLTLRP